LLIPWRLIFSQALSPQSSVLKAAAIAAALLAAGCAATNPPTAERAPAAAPAGASRGAVHSRGYLEIQQMVFPPLALSFPRAGWEVERRVLANGLVLYLYPDRRLPLVEATALIRGGTAYEGEDTWTAMVLLGSQLRAGGTAATPAAALDATLERMAASIETQAGTEAITATLSVLSRDVDRGLDLLVQVLRTPAFDAAKLQVAQGRLLEEIRRRDEDPARLAGRTFSRLLYTDRHPEGRELDPARVRAVTPADLRALHARYLHPNIMFLAVAGDFDPADMAGRVERAFGSWPRAEVTLPRLPRAEHRLRAGVYVVPRPLGQATIVLGHLGIDRTNPDRYVVELMDIILGRSGFTSRITERVRSDEGLAYSVGTFYATGTRDLGAFRTSVQTKNESVGRATTAVLEEIRKMTETAVAEEELATAKEALVNSFVFRWQSPMQVATQLMALEFDGLPPDYYDTLLDRYRAVRPPDILRVAQHSLHPDHMTIVVVGDPARFDRPLSTFGPVTQLSPSGKSLPQ
jgi:predicted Zn-dependent peptidase